MAVLVCGGAGYIGSITVREFLAAGEEVIVADNFRTGHREALPARIQCYEADIRDREALDRIFTENDIDAVVHFAANSLVGESVVQPLLYFRNNVYGMQVLLEAMVAHGVDKIVFSSSAAVYGEPERIPIQEDDRTYPTNPYGETKLVMERLMHWVSKANGIRFVSFRYFNAAGALPDGSLGEAHAKETHLIPLILQVPLGQRSHISIYGEDYDTPDGTCIRDYIHVLDLADAHMRAVNYLRKGGVSDVFNLGNGEGVSVKEILAAAELVTGETIRVEVDARRAGDPARLVASSEKARRILDWRPRHPSVEEMIQDAWTFHQRNSLC